MNKEKEIFEVEGEEIPEEMKISEEGEDFLEEYTRRLTMIDREIAVIMEQASRRVKALQGRRKSYESFYKASADAIFLSLLRQKKGKSKFIDTGYGRIKMRESKGYVTYAGTAQDLRKMLGDAAGAFIEQKEAVKTLDLKKRLTNSGESVFYVNDSGEMVELASENFKIVEATVKIEVESKE